MLLSPWLKQTSWLQEVSEIRSDWVITWLPVIDLISTKQHFFFFFFLICLAFYDATPILCPVIIFNLK